MLYGDIASEYASSNYCIMDLKSKGSKISQHDLTFVHLFARASFFWHANSSDGRRLALTERFTCTQKIYYFRTQITRNTQTDAGLERRLT